MTATDKACQNQNQEPLLLIANLEIEIRRQERRLVCAHPGSGDWRDALQQLHRLSEQL